MISVIIPTLNEEENLPETLAALAATSEQVEVVVCDAGSEDGTISVAEASGARVVTCEKRQRAAQLNAGAAIAKGDALWFLHADTWVPPTSVRALRQALDDEDVVGGGFKRRFRSASPLLLVSCWIAGIRSARRGLYFGDQSIFVRKGVFEEMRGFHDLPVFEDFDFCKRLRVLGEMRCLSPPVRSSARRFTRRGTLKVVLHDLWLTWCYHRGESPHSIWKRLQRS